MSPLVITAIYFTCVGIFIGWIGEYMHRRKDERKAFIGEYEYLKSKKEQRFKEKGC